MDRASELTEIEKYLAERGATRCPTVAVAPVTGLEQPADVPVPPEPTRKDRHRTAMGWTKRKPATPPRSNPGETAEASESAAGRIKNIVVNDIEPPRRPKRTESKSRAAEILAEDPNRSDRSIAGELGCSRKTVALARSAAGIPALFKTAPTLDRAREAVAQDPSRSTRAIAKAIGCSPMTVMRARQSLAGKCPVCGR